MTAPYFELITELQVTNRRDFPVKTSGTLAAGMIDLNPVSARPLVEGEWLRLNSDYLLERGGDNNAGTADEETNAAVFPVHTERGRYDTQSLGKVNVIMLQMYEAETQVTGTLAGLNIGDALTVQDVTVGGIVRRGLAAAGVTAGRVVVGFVSKITGTKLRFVHFGNQKM